MMISAQKISESTPSTAARVTAPPALAAVTASRKA
jgi:hypothetical protein